MASQMKGEDPCWKNYEMVGMKKQDGKEVPNCVPKAKSAKAKAKAYQSSRQSRGR
jgi:hypothetical protein